MQPRREQRLIWENEPAAVLASGPSLCQEDIDLIEKSGIKTIAVNSTWEAAKFCDVIYGGDSAWWRYNHKRVNIPAERWTCARAAQTLYSCHYRQRQIKPGYNSGASAVELAANHYGASPIIMLGFDCSVVHGIHHHGKHPKTSNPNTDRCERWKPQFKTLRNITKGKEIINCSRYTEIKYFPIRDLREVLCELGCILGS